MVHLHGNRLWTTLNEKNNHDELEKKCDFHLVYLGRGIFAELSPRIKPLVEIEDQTNVTSLVIGMLTSTEQTVINKLSKLGVGFAIDQTTGREDKPSTSTSIVHDQELKNEQAVELAAKPKVVQNIADIPSVSVTVEKLKLSPTDRVN